MTQIFATISSIFGPEALRTLVLEWTPRIVAAVLTGVVFYFVVRGVGAALKRVFTRVGLDPTASGFLNSITRFALVLVGALTVLNQLGIDTTSLLASLGVLSLTVGFAAQNTLSNVISGLFIFWDRPFVIGDLVEVDGEYGRVDEVTLRSTRLVTVDGRMLAFPNSQIANAKVASYTNFPTLRIDVDVTIGVNEPVGRVRDLLLAIVTSDPAYMSEPPPVVVVTNLGDYNVTVELRAWLREERDHVRARFAMREQIKTTLDAAGVVMPYETIQLEPLEVRRAMPGEVA
jgi:small conductance mechanosensitive channel